MFKCTRIVDWHRGEYAVDLAGEEDLWSLCASGTIGDGYKVAIVDEYFADHAALAEMRHGGAPIELFTVHAVESSKTLKNVMRACEFLHANDVTSSHNVLVLGGGITQDVAGTALGLYKRGTVPWTLVPTTLLAMCDSGIGGKTCVNGKDGGAKNQFGLFHAPTRVVICMGLLETLSPLAMLSGAGELAKLLLIGGDTDLFESLRFNEVGRPLVTLEHLSKALGVKCDRVEQDEFDQGDRRELSLGHTFGHAFEVVTEFTVPHGIAVCMAMTALCQNEEDWTWPAACVGKCYDIIKRAFKAMPPATAARVHTLTQGGEGERESAMSIFMSALRADKKKKGNRVTVVTLTSPGYADCEMWDLSARPIIFQEIFDRLCSMVDMCVRAREDAVVPTAATA